MKVTIRHTVDRLAAMLQRAATDLPRATDQAVQRVAIEASRIMRDDAPKSLSELVNSIRNERLAQSFHRSIADAPHAAYVHDGTGPGGAPPIEALRRWARLAQLRPLEGRSERDMLFLIQRKIRRQGTPAQPFTERAIRTSQERMLALVPRAARDSIEVALS